ncbi:MAG: leucine-rich repeat protein [Clostridia bacterium]|nr:leucine-rich repeat protein [Clostridia bacterium]
MMKKSFITILLSIFVSITVAFSLAGCTAPSGEPSTREEYTVSFGYSPLAGGYSEFLEVSCNLGEPLIMPAFPVVSGVAFVGWMTEFSTEPLQPGDQITVTADMFHPSGERFDGNEKVIEYSCQIYGRSETLDLTATIHYNGTDTDTMDYTISVYDHFYFDLDHALCRWADVPNANSLVGEFDQHAGYTSQLVGNVYIDDYVFDGWYFDENYETPYDNDLLNSGTLGSVDIYAKWTYTGLTFEYTPMNYAPGYYTLTSISTLAPTNELVIPAKIHDIYVQYMQANIYQGTHRITKLVLPERLIYVPTNAFTNELISEVVVTEWTGFQKRAFNGSNAIVTLPENASFFYQDGILYEMSVSDDGYGNDKPIIYSVSSDLSGDIVLPMGVVSLDGFLAGTDITGITLPRTMKEIPAGEFAGCTSLEKVVIVSDTYNTRNPGIHTIKSGAFEGCTSLNTLVIGASLRSIEANAFETTSTPVQVYYRLDSTYWSNIQNGDTGLNATVYYYSATEPTSQQLASGDKYWHYGENQTPIPWRND